MRTDEGVQGPLTHERVGRFLAGTGVLATVVMAQIHNPAWMVITGAIALNLLVSGITDRCKVKTLLVRMGFPGERDLGRIVR